MWLGDFAAGVTLDLKFTTRRFTTGAPHALAAGAVSVYKDNNTTQSTSGVTLSADFDGVTGLNNVRIDLSSDGTFYAAGSNFQVVITTGTVDSVSVVGEVVGWFSIANRPLQSIGAGVITATALASDAITDAKVASDVTIASVTGAVGSVTGAVGSVTGNVGGNVTGSVGSVVGAVGSVTGAVGSVTGSVGSIATGGITTASFAAGAINAAAIATDAIDADALAADAGTELGIAVWATTTRQLTGTQAFNLTGNITGNLSGSVGSVTGAVGSVTGSVGSIASGGITTASFAAGAINAAAIGTNAIDADALAADAVTEITAGISVPTAIQNADALLDRDMATGTDSGSTTVRTPRQALRFLRNKWSVAGTTLSVHKENDSTVSWTSEVTTSAGADPIVANDPAGP